MISFVKSLMDIISSEPIFTGPIKSDCINESMPFMQSSINKKGAGLFAIAPNFHLAAIGGLRPPCGKWQPARFFPATPPGALRSIYVMKGAQYGLPSPNCDLNAIYMRSLNNFFPAIFAVGFGGISRILRAFRIVGVFLIISRIHCKPKRNRKFCRLVYARQLRQR